jgi:TonB family protein
MLLMTTIGWAAFALIYAVLLRRETFFQANRYYLLLTLPAGWLIGGGWLQWSGTWVAQVSDFGGPVWTITQTAPASQQFVTDYRVWLWTFYAAGLLVSLARLFKGLVVIFHWKRASRLLDTKGGVHFYTHPSLSVPFSFLNWVFLPDVPDHDPQTLLLMRTHEYAHARARHTFDVLWAELHCIVFWFHPLVWWYRHALRQNHEYSADAQAVQLTTKKQYGLLLIQQSHSGVPIAFVHHFFHSPLKQRIIMLTRKSSAPWRLLRFLWVIPVALLLLAACQKTTLDATDEVVMPEFPGGIPALISYLTDAVQYPAEARNAKLQGKVFVEFIVEQDGSISNIKDAKPAEGMGILVTEGVRVVKTMPNWIPGTVNGKKAAVKYTLPIMFKLD